MLNKLRLLTPGPTPLPEESRLALAKDMIHHRKADFKKLMAEVQEKLRLLFGSTTPVLPLSSSGTGAMTAAVGSLFAPGEKVLVVEAGKFGERWVEIATCRDLEVTRLEIPWGEAVTPEALQSALNKDSAIKGVLTQISETSTGALMPVKDMAAITSSRDILLVADGISAVGISPCPMAEWGIDCLLTGSQKGLMLPPGLAFIALSDRAWKRAESVKPACYYFNLLAEKANVAKGQTHFTSAINLIVGLDASLDLLLKDGLAAIYRKQWALTSLVRAGASALGLSLLAKKDFAWGVTAMLMPDGVDSGAILKGCEEKFGVVMAGGQDKLKGKIVRLGHMGWVDWADCLAGLMALKNMLMAYGHTPPDMDLATVALSAYESALAETEWQ